MESHNRSQNHTIDYHQGVHVHQCILYIETITMTSIHSTYRLQQYDVYTLHSTHQYDVYTLHRAHQYDVYTLHRAHQYDT